MLNAYMFNTRLVLNQQVCKAGGEIIGMQIAHDQLRGEPEHAAEPGKILSIDTSNPELRLARVKFCEAVRDISIQWLDDVKVGDYIMAHVGTALSKVDEEDAAFTLNALREMGESCPVCVTPVEMIDRAIALGELPEVTLTSFGDMLRVPGTYRSSQGQGPGRRHPDGLFPAGYP